MLHHKSVFISGSPGSGGKQQAELPLGMIISYLFSFFWFFLTNHSTSLCFSAAILDDPMECNRGERLAITLAKESINRKTNRSTTGKLEVDIFELLRDSEYEMGETSK